MRIYDFRFTIRDLQNWRETAVNPQSKTVNSRAAFTMIEIAISLAVIGFALVAIIGVLPTGITVQKDNREDTIINQDGPYWLEAIRNGAKGMDHLTNYVDTVTIHSVCGPIGLDRTIIYTNNPGQKPFPYDGSMTNGQSIIGLLSVLKYNENGFHRVTNTVTARVRGLTGSAVEQGRANEDFSFTYQLQVEIVPFITKQVSMSSTNYLFNDPNDPAPANADLKAAWEKERKINWIEAKSREQNTSEIRLTFRWPLLPNGNTGPHRKVFRVLATGEQVFTNRLPYFQPQSFAVRPIPAP